MNFLKKIFGTTDPPQKKLIRAQYKNYEYFKKELNFYDETIDIINEDNKVLVIKNGKMLSEQYASLYSLFIKKVNLLYSAGSEIVDIKLVFEQAFDNYILSYNEIDEMYMDLLEVWAKAILFDIDIERIKKLAEIVEKMNNNSRLELWKPDKLVGYFLHSKLPEFETPPYFLFPHWYQSLERVIDVKNKDIATANMKEYLEKWYGYHKDESWYDNHKYSRGYDGYWCWEAAAIVKIRKLEDSSFKDSPYYPYDLVHWQDNL